MLTPILRQYRGPPGGAVGKPSAEERALSGPRGDHRCGYGAHAQAVFGATPGARGGGGVCLRPRSCWPCSGAPGLCRVVRGSVGPFSASSLPPSPCFVLRCGGPTPEGPQEGMKGRERGGPGLPLRVGGGRCEQEAWGCRSPARGWLAGPPRAGLVERMSSPAWRSPWLALGAGVGEGSPGPARAELGGWAALPPAWLQPSGGRLRSGPGAGDRPPPWLAAAQGPLPAAARKVRGADVGLTSPPPSSASPGGSLLLGSRTSWGSWGERRLLEDEAGCTEWGVRESPACQGQGQGQVWRRQKGALEPPDHLCCLEEIRGFLGRGVIEGGGGVL